MSLDKLFSLSKDTKNIEFECRFRLDIPNQEILQILKSTQRYSFTTENRIVRDYKSIAKVKYRKVDDLSQKKIQIESQCINIQGYVIKFDVSLEEDIDKISSEFIQERRRERYITNLCDFAELHLTTNVVNGVIDDMIEIEYKYAKTTLKNLFDPIKILFDILYVKSYGLLDSKQMISLINEFNEALKYVKQSKSVITQQDIRDQESHQVINFEEKPVNLPKNINLSEYFVTNKLNGVRYFMFIYKRSIFLLSKGGKKRKNFANVWWFYNDLKIDKTCILEGEYFNNKFWIFDILMYVNRSVVNEPFGKRLGFMTEFAQYYTTSVFGLKTIYPVMSYTTDIMTLIAYCKNTFGEDWSWDNDGLILNHSRATYADNSLKTYKWKFNEHQTIDVQVGDQIQPNIYGINVKTSSGYERFDLLTNQKGLYSPTPLTKGTIVEVKWVGKYELPFSFISTRVRADKVEPNYINTAKSVWTDIIEPIPLEDLKVTILTVNDQRTEWEKYRIYSNNKKSELISKYVKNDLVATKSKFKLTENIGIVVLDIGFGKGGDFQKYKKAGVTKIYAFEPDINNIREFYKRYQILNFKNVSYNVYEMAVENINITLFNMDATMLAIPDIRDMIKHPIDTVCLFFSLTYFFGMKQNFVNLFNSIFKLNGKLDIIGTVMDGEKTEEFLKKYRWDPVRCGFKMNKKNVDELYIEIASSETVKGHTEYLVEWDRMVNYLKLYGYKLDNTDFYNYIYSSDFKYNLVHNFSTLNRTFVFKFDPTSSRENIVYLDQMLEYNTRLALPKDCTYFLECKNLITPVENMLKGVFKDKAISSEFIEYKDGVYRHNGIIISDLTPYRNHLLTGIYSENELNYRSSKTVSKFNTTILVEKTITPHISQIPKMLQREISPTLEYDIYEISPGTGDLTREFLKYFKKVKSVDTGDLNSKVWDENYKKMQESEKDKVEKIKMDQVRNADQLTPKVIFIDAYLFKDDFDVYSKDVVVRIPISRFDKLPKNYRKLYKLDDGFIVIY